jgi:ABC-type nitrate/sulfonate/bicarbonate transport system ATPase subunit
MPQADALLPWLRVIDNVALGLTTTGTPKRQARTAALPLLERFGLAGFARAYPGQLSGGMRQRVAFLRTVLTGRPILLLDEPFGALDSVTRHDMQTWLAEVWAATGATVVLITHDVSEAIYLSDTVHVLTTRPGRLHATIHIDLPRPRPASVLETTEFSRYEAHLRRELRVVSTDGTRQ